MDELYRICEYARSITLERPALLGRIIARPYVGEPGNFTRTANRRDLAVSPFAPTVLDKLNEAGIDTYAVGKINVSSTELVSTTIWAITNQIATV